MTARVSLHQCLECERYLQVPRDATGLDPQTCAECRARWGVFDDAPQIPGIPLATIRGPESLTPTQVELLGLLTEECGEVSQRVGKILRWGFDADFEGTTQQHKLEVELGDILAAMILSIGNGLVTAGGILQACREKMKKLVVDRDGPAQRIRHAKVRDDALILFAVPVDDHPEVARAKMFESLRDMYCLACGDMQPARGSCQCENDE